MGLIAGAIALAMISASLLPAVDAEPRKCNPQRHLTGDPHNDVGAPKTGDPHDNGEKGNPHDRCKQDDNGGHGEEEE